MLRSLCRKQRPVIQASHFATYSPIPFIFEIKTQLTDLIKSQIKESEFLLMSVDFSSKIEKVVTLSLIFGRQAKQNNLAASYHHFPGKTKAT